MSFDEKAYRREWARNKRKERGGRERTKELDEKGKCHVCEMLLSSKYHVGCPGIHMHKNIDDSANN